MLDLNLNVMIRSLVTSEIKKQNQGCHCYYENKVLVMLTFCSQIIYMRYKENANSLTK